MKGRYDLYAETNICNSIDEIELHYFIMSVIHAIIKLKVYGGYDQTVIQLMRDNFTELSAKIILPLIPDPDPAAVDENIAILYNNSLARFNQYADFVLKTFQSNCESEVQHNGYILVAYMESHLGIWRSDIELRVEGLHISAVVLDISASVANAFRGSTELVTKSRDLFAKHMSK